MTKDTLLSEIKERWLLKQLQHKHEQYKESIYANRFELMQLIKQLKGLKYEK